MNAPVSADPATLIDRLRMRYPTGPIVKGEPEFGWRDMSGPAPEGCVLPTPLMLEAANEIERLRRELTEEKRRSFQGSRITYRGFSYGVGSEHGIDSLRRAIEGNGHG